MNEQSGGSAPIGTGTWRRVFSGPGMMALAGALVVIMAVAIGLDVGGLRERLLGGVGGPRVAAIAVLPFENLSRDPAHEHVADGMTAELTTVLGQVGTLRVIGFTSVRQYKEKPKSLADIARDLKVDGVLEGSVLLSGDRVRISARLVHPPTDQQLWEHTYEGALRDILDLQGEVVRAIAQAVEAPLTPEQHARLTARRPVNPRAYDAYLRGVYGKERQNAEAHLTQAADLDAEFALPHVALASRRYFSNFFAAFAPRDTYPKVKDAAQRALDIDPTLARAHLFLALVSQEYDWNFVEAEKAFKRALELSPNAADIRHLYSHFLLSADRAEEARAEEQRAEAIDPADAGLIACFAWHSVATDKPEEAEERAQRALGMGAGSFPRLFLGWSYAQRGRFDEAVVELQSVVASWGGAVYPTALLGHAYAAAGREAEAREVLDRLLARSKTEYVPGYDIATVYAGLGERDRAFDWLQKASEERSNALGRFRMDPRLRSLWADSRFQDLLRRVQTADEPSH